MTIPPIPPGPASAMAAAASGLRRAGAQAADAAGRIAASGVPLEPAGGDDSARTAVAAAAAAPDMARGMVDLLLARGAYAANAAVLRTADEMAGEMLRRNA